MRHTEEFINQHLPEPPNGTRLVVDSGDNEYRVIWRDDAEAKRWDGHPLDRWFCDVSDDPMSLAAHLRYAEAVYELGYQILKFGGDDRVLS